MASIKVRHNGPYLVDGDDVTQAAEAAVPGSQDRPAWADK